MKRHQAQTVLSLVLLLPLILAPNTALLAQTAAWRLVPTNEIPKSATFASMQLTNLPPLPFNPYPQLDAYAWSGAPGWIWVDDRLLDLSAIQQQRLMNRALRSMESQSGLNSPGDLPPDPGGWEGSGGDDSPPPAGPAIVYPDGSLWVEPVSMASNRFNALLHGATSGSNFLIISTGELNPPTNSTWLVEGSLQGTTNDATPFALGIATRTNNLFIRAQTCDPSCASTALPLAWQLENFGVTGVDPGGLDPLGYSFLDDWLNGRDPNKIQFSVLFDNLRVSGNTATATFNILQGVPAQVGVLVDSGTNFALATWTSYSPTVSVTLGSTEGRHDVWLALKGMAPNSEATWEGFRLTRDTTAPAIFITSPLATTLSQPLLQLQGFSLEPLTSVRYDVTNAAGTLTGLEGYTTRQWFDTNLLAFTTNWFECLDIPLTNGVNTITLYATDQAGNVTTLSTNFTLDYSGVSSGPALTLYWPQDGTVVSGTSFTLRGLLDDPTATVTARITDGNGVASAVDGLVERNGLLWVENLPLGPGANTLTLMMTNAAGLPSSTSLTVTQSDVILTIADLSTTDLNQPRILVNGIISVDGYTVWVNGMQVTTVWPNGNGTYGWQVDGVPVNDGGTAVIQARAIPNTDYGGNGTGGSGGTVSTMANPGNPSSPQARDNEADPDRKPVVVQIHYDKTLEDTFTEPAPSQYFDIVSETILWDLGREGRWLWSECWGTPSNGYFGWNDAFWDATGVGTLTAGQHPGPNVCGSRAYSGFLSYEVCPPWPAEYCAVAASRDVDDPCLWDGHDSRVRSAKTRYELHTNGKSSSKRQHLFVGSTTALGVGNYFWPEWDTDRQAYSIPPTSIELGVFGRLGSDGRSYKVLADNETMDITPTVQGIPYYTFEEPVATKHKLLIWANSRLLEPDKVADDAKFCVGQWLGFVPTWEQLPPYAGDPPGVSAPPAYDWTMSSKYVNRKSQPNSAGCVTYDVDLNLLKYWMPNAWYISGGDKNIRLNLTLQFNNGQSAKLSESGKFNVFRPTVSFPFTTIPPMIPMLTNGWLQLGNASQYGGDDVGTMNFNAKITSKTPFTGNGNWTQLIQRSASYPDNATDTGGRYDLDTSIHYNTSDASITLRGNNPIPYGIVDFYDSPGVGEWTLWSITIRDNFQTYLVFRPDGHVANIWVTLGIVTWGWGATESGTILLSPTNTPPTYQDSDSFPVWTKVSHGQGQ